MPQIIGFATTRTPAEKKKVLNRQSLSYLRMLLIPRTGNREQGTGNREQGIGNRDQGIGNREQGTGNRERGTGNRGGESGN